MKIERRREKKDRWKEKGNERKREREGDNKILMAFGSITKIGAEIFSNFKLLSVIMKNLP
jgi:hypothetical protein